MIDNLVPFDASNPRGKLYGVEFDFRPEAVDDPDFKSAMIWWCYNMYGIGYRNYSCQHDNPHTARWVNDLEYGIIKFKEEADYMHFMLVWDR